MIRLRIKSPKISWPGAIKRITTINKRRSSTRSLKNKNRKHNKCIRDNYKNSITKMSTNCPIRMLQLKNKISKNKINKHKNNFHISI
jgi:hypothetical protein